MPFLSNLTPPPVVVGGAYDYVASFYNVKTPLVVGGAYVASFHNVKTPPPLGAFGEAYVVSFHKVKTPPPLVEWGKPICSMFI